ncbi:hypothetical protein SAMN05428959_11070 [Duganella sp. CF517]|uniref:hypothetical protein n=1 Tax=Duganella sp. CF517 TaxID=1881038 RepID=UPI0008B219DE|nr:hypothetical protein [Duganella sp. CF517]SEO57829.1 hypothetical protein SAMN05428959_11070 [Duganella sp. CF517]
MTGIASGDLVTEKGERLEMLVIGSADEDPYVAVTTVFCVWERDHMLHEEIFHVDNLALVRKERRRVIRGGNLDFPGVK